MTPAMRKGLICLCWIMQGEAGLNYHREFKVGTGKKIPPVMRGAGLESPLPRFLGEPAPRRHGISWH